MSEYAETHQRCPEVCVVFTVPNGTHPLWEEGSQPKGMYQAAPCTTTLPPHCGSARPRKVFYCSHMQTWLSVDRPLAHPVLNAKLSPHLKCCVLMADPKPLHNVLYCFISMARNTQLDLAVSRRCGNPSLIIMHLVTAELTSPIAGVVYSSSSAVIPGALLAFGQGPGPQGEEHGVGCGSCTWHSQRAVGEVCLALAALALHKQIWNSPVDKFSEMF